MGYKPQAIIDRLNRIGIDLPHYDFEVISWRETADMVGLLDGLDDSATEFMAAWPAEMMESVTALVRAAARNGARLRFAWTPGYDFGVTVSKANYSADEAPEYTVHLTSNYPPEVAASGR